MGQGTKSRRKNKKRQTKIIPILRGSPNGKVISYKKLKQKTMNETEQMKQSSLFRLSWSILKAIVSWNHLSIDSIECIKVNILCLGVGNFGNSLSSMQQISFLHAIMNECKERKSKLI